MAETTPTGERAPDELRGERFAIIPESILAEKADVVKLYGILARRANSDHRLWPGQAWLAEQMECSDRHVRRLLARLQEVGALREVKRRWNGSTIYELVTAGLGSPVRPDRGVQIQPTDRTGESALSGLGSPPNESHERKPSRSPIARSIPVPFVLSDDMRDWAAENVPSVSAEFETPAFVDHHTANGSTFKDWGAAWRKWMRNAAKYQAERATTNGHGPRRPTTTVERSWQNIKATEHLS